MCETVCLKAFAKSNVGVVWLVDGILAVPTNSHLWVLGFRDAGNPFGDFCFDDRRDFCTE
jgi:hypothetical protein